MQHFGTANSLVRAPPPQVGNSRAERAAPASKIKTFPDALWWAVATVTTVGYGDYAPTTGTGRCTAVGLMVAGIALLGVVTATLASWLVQKVAEQDDANQAVTQQQIAELTVQITALRHAIALDDTPAPGNSRSMASRCPKAAAIWS